ncbi:MAG: hypothetical protein ABSB39_00960 [Candidatus Sulfotelmatobacter sp.]
MSGAPRSRKRFKISDSLDRQLNAYAQVAIAAGVSVLALAGTSEAKVVYAETYQDMHPSVPLYIDLNHDGINDFQLRTILFRGTSSPMSLSSQAGPLAKDVTGAQPETLDRLALGKRSLFIATGGKWAPLF